MGAVFGVVAAQAALRERDITGNGQRVSSALLGVGRGGGRWHLVDLRRQPRRILRDLPAPVGLRTGLDKGLPRLPAYRERSRMAAACRLIGWGATRQWRCRGARGGGRLARRLQDVGLGRQSGCVLHHLPAAVRLFTRLAPGLLRSPARRYRPGEVVAYGLRWWHDRNLWGLTSRAGQGCGQNRGDAFHWHSAVAHRPGMTAPFRANHDAFKPLPSDRRRA
jgi:hypothetical protein